MGGRLPVAVLALDLGGSQIRAAVVAADGTLGHRIAVRTPSSEGPDAVVAACVRVLEDVRRSFEAAATEIAGDLAGIGISAPGPVDPFRGIVVDPPNLGPGFRDVPLADRVEEALGLPATLDRDTQVAAMGEGVLASWRPGVLAS